MVCVLGELSFCNKEMIDVDADVDVGRGGGGGLG